MIDISYNKWNQVMQPAIWKKAREAGCNDLRKYLNCNISYPNSYMGPCRLEFKKSEDELYFRLKWEIK